MMKSDPIESMMRLAETVANIIVIPEHCTLEKDDIYQEVCLLYLERGYTQTPGILRERVVKAINNYVSQYGCEIACGLLPEVIEYNTETADIAAAISAVAATVVKEALKTLTPREELVIRTHFGIDDGDERNLEDTGNKLGVSRNRASQIEHKGIRKLGHPSRSYLMRDAIEMLNTDNCFM